MEVLDRDIRYLKGIGEARAKMFQKLGITTVEDLLYFFPRDYEDRTKTAKVAECQKGETACVRAAVFSAVKENHIRKNMSVYTAIISDDTGAMNVVWYNNRFVKNALEPGKEYVFYGKISENRGRREMQNPIYEEVGRERYTGRIAPIYPLTEGLSQNMIQSAMERALEEAGALKEYMPQSIREHYHIAELNFAMKNIHFPADFKSYEIARRRFVFEELLTVQLLLLRIKKDNSRNAGAVFEDTECMREFAGGLPFALTGAQERVLSEIADDLCSGRQMNRLVQGDVGSGKTAVAAAAIYCAVKNGQQAVMMAPTEILAAQHYETLKSFFEPYGICVELLTGGMGIKEKRRVTESIQLGLAQVVVGTHALIQKGVEYKELGLVIADEQHRFGVSQRAKLCAKGAAPHMLLMSATPIPRTLALILYGDLDISIIDELPPGRKPVKTYAVGESMRKRIYAFLKKQLDCGFQAYVVCPLIEETEKSDLKDAVQLAEKLTAIFPEYKVGLIHGKLKPKHKEEIMEDFAQNRIQILVSTTVIEVGMNVPNSNIMVIENAERFGLAQLHQLRGRVGRGGDQAYCILFVHGKNEITKKRMDTMCMSNDGFFISEQDLKLRGPGDFFGTRQHGLPEMRIANLFEDGDILKDAQEAAVLIMKEPGFEYEPLIKRAEMLMNREIILN